MAVPIILEFVKFSREDFALTKIVFKSQLQTKWNYNILQSQTVDALKLKFLHTVCW